MKLANLKHVEKLSADRDYARSLIVVAEAAGFGMRLGKYDVRPDLKERVAPALVEVFQAEVRRIDADLAALGVTLD